MAEVTHHEPFLTLVREPLPEGVRGVYQLGDLFHLGPRTAGMFVNIREVHDFSNDVEIGNGLVIFSDPELRKADSIQSVNRAKLVKQDSGYARELTYPLYGAFVPIGSGLPHEGTGFARPQFPHGSPEFTGLCACGWKETYALFFPRSEPLGKHGPQG